jgi:hypothetical protein
MKAAIFNDDVPWIKEGRIFDKVFAAGRRARLAEIADLYPEQITSANFEEHAGNLADLEVIFSTWDMPRLNEEQVRGMPRLKALFYAAGATSHFREPFERSGVLVCSATAANAIPVAEFALGQVLLAGADNLKPEFAAPDVPPATLLQMARDPLVARRMVLTNRAKYEAAQQNSLTLQPLPEGLLEIQRSTAGPFVTMDVLLEPDDLRVFVFGSGAVE